MLLHSLSLEEWLASLTGVNEIDDRAPRHFTPEVAEENRETDNR